MGNTQFTKIIEIIIWLILFAFLSYFLVRYFASFGGS
jgi:hypothetical protein